MRVNEIMTMAVQAVPPELDAESAWHLMHDARIRHLAVTRARRLVGVVSERDLGNGRASAQRKGRCVADLMTTDVVSIGPAATIREAANLLRGRVIGCLPVLDKGKVVGIVTTTDLLDLIGRGAERPVVRGKRWTLKHRGPRKAAQAARR